MAKLTQDEIKWILSIDAKGAQKEIAATSSEIRNLEQSNRLMNTEMKAAEKQMKLQEKEMQKLARAGKQDSEAYQEAQSSMQSARAEMDSYILKIGENNKSITENKNKLNELKETMDVNEMSMKQLRQRASDLQKQLDVTSLAANPKEYKDLQKELDVVRTRMGEVRGSGESLITQFSAMNNPVGVATRAVTGFGHALKALIANPVGIIIMAIAAAFMALKAAINSSEEASNKFQQVMAPFRVLMDLVLNIVQKLVKGFLDLTLAVMDWTTKTLEKVPIVGKWMTTLNEKAKEGVEIEKQKLDLKHREREALVENAKKENEIAKLRNEARQRENFTNEEIIEKLEHAIQLEREIAEEKIEQAKIKLHLLELESRHAENIAETNQQIAEQTALVIQLETEFYNSTRRMESEINSRKKELRQEDEAAARAALEKRVKDIDMTLQQETNTLKQQLADNLITRAEFDEALEKQTILALNEKLKIAGLEKDKRLEIEQQILDFKIQALEQEKEFNKARETLLLEWHNRTLSANEQEKAAVEKKYSDELESLKISLDKKLITELEFAEISANLLAEKQKELSEKTIEQNKETAEKELTELLRQKELETMSLQESYNAGLISKEEYESSKLALDKKYADLSLSIENLSTESRIEIQQKMLDASTLLMEKETEKQEKEQEKRAALYSKFSEQIGTMLGGVIAGNEDLVKSSLKTILNMALDALEAQITMSIASATAQSFAQADSVATFGASGAARAGILTALIKGAFAGVKAIVNNALSSNKSTKPQSAATDVPVTGSRVVIGRQSGGYMDVSRAQDGKKYKALFDPKLRGFINRPTVLVGDGPAGKSMEWVASNDALQNPTIAPIIHLLNEAQLAGNIRTIDINQLMRARMAGFESGGFINQPVVQAPAQHPVSASSNNNELFEDIKELLQHLKNNGVKAPVVLTELQRKQELLETSRKIGSK